MILATSLLLVWRFQIGSGDLISVLVAALHPKGVFGSLGLGICRIISLASVLAVGALKQFKSV